jgi:hypothetical protein
MLSSAPLLKFRPLKIIDELESVAVPMVTRVPEQVLVLVFQTPAWQSSKVVLFGLPLPPSCT